MDNLLKFIHSLIQTFYSVDLIIQCIVLLVTFRIVHRVVLGIVFIIFIYKVLKEQTEEGFPMTG